MRNFVETLGRNQRSTNRKDGSKTRREDHDDGVFETSRQPHDARRERRVSRELMRRVRNGEPFPLED
jgi:hypothetical protein